MKDLEIYFVVGMLAVLLMIVVISWLFARSRRSELSELPEEQEYGKEQETQD